MTFTFLRDNFYADFVPYFADENGVIRGPAGDGLFAPVARADVADVAAVVLRSPADHANTTYELTGPEAFTMAGAAARAGACWAGRCATRSRLLRRPTPPAGRRTARRTGSSTPG